MRCQSCETHDPRDRRDHGHLPARLFPEPTVQDEAERLLSYWEQHGDNSDAVSKWAVSDLLGFVRLVLGGDSA